MDLAQLSERIFRDGVGISRSYALGSSRYQQLVEESSGHPYQTNAQTAEIQYLGERLADRAFANLPIDIRRQAERWSGVDTEAQERTLRCLMNELQSKHWVRRARSVSTLKGAVALPAQTGNWNRGATQPNCLGLSQMLIGFARTTGSRHMLVNVIQPATMTRERSMYNGLSHVLELLAELPQSSAAVREQQRVRSFLRTVLGILDRAHNERAHHALAIESHGRWWLVDPYLAVMHRLEKKVVERAYRHSHSQPGEVLTMLGGLPKEMTRERSIAWGMASFALMSLQEVRQPSSDYRELIDIAWWAGMYAVYDSRHHHEEGTELHFEPEEMEAILKKQRCWKDAESRAAHFQNFIVFTDIEKVDTDNASDEEIRAHHKHALAELEVSRSAQRDVYRRFLEYSANLIVWWGSDYTQNDEWNRHAVIELVEASHGLATATMNHIAFAAHLKVPALIELSASQAIIRDNMGIVESHGTAFHRDVLARRLQRKLEMAPALLHPDLRFRREVEYGKAQNTE